MIYILVKHNILLKKFYEKPQINDEDIEIIKYPMDIDLEYYFFFKGTIYPKKLKLNKIKEEKKKKLNKTFLKNRKDIDIKFFDLKEKLKTKEKYILFIDENFSDDEYNSVIGKIEGETNFKKLSKLINDKNKKISYKYLKEELEKYEYIKIFNLYKEDLENKPSNIFLRKSEEYFFKDFNLFVNKYIQKKFNPFLFIFEGHSLKKIINKEL